jgi:UDP-N-acetylglucosamine transferase subunit ALG13
MIFVTVGTNEARFDRLLQAVAGLPLEEEILVQHGHSSPIGPAHAQLVEFLSFDDMVETVRRARAVVTHAGVGSIMVALANAKRPIVLPRRSSFGEAVDDHQLELGNRFAASGLVTLIDSGEALERALAQEPQTATVIPASSSLASDLRSFLEDAVAGTSLAAHV